MKRELNVSPTSSSDIESRKKRKLQFGDGKSLCDILIFFCTHRGNNAKIPSTLTVGPEEDPVKLSITLPRVPVASDSVINSLKHSNGVYFIEKPSVSFVVFSSSLSLDRG